LREGYFHDIPNPFRNLQLELFDLNLSMLGFDHLSVKVNGSIQILDCMDGPSCLYLSGR
jgi:hypothetical protein